MSRCRRDVTVIAANEESLCSCGPPIQFKCRDLALSEGREPEYPHRPVFVVDWDGTCVEEYRPDGTPYWPEMGPWLDGAVEALRTLSAMGKTVIWSLRGHLYEMDDKTPRPRGAAGLSEAAIRSMLGDVGLGHIEVYQPSRGKPPGRYYIDDRGVRFGGDWTETLRFVRGLELRRELESDGPVAA